MRTQETDEWARKSLPLLKELGYLEEEVIDNSGMKIFIALLIGFALAGVLFYGIQKDAFKSNSNQTFNLEPNITVNSPSIENNYDFKPNTENEYKIYNNHTIYITNINPCNCS